VQRTAAEAQLQGGWREQRLVKRAPDGCAGQLASAAGSAAAAAGGGGWGYVGGGGV
jgi:hypothetical protein